MKSPFFPKTKFGCKALQKGSFNPTRKDLVRMAKMCTFRYRVMKELGIRVRFIEVK